MAPTLQARIAGGDGIVLVRFTEDMAETLIRFFHAYQADDVVTLQLTERGLWLVNPHNGSRQFLGQAALTEAENEARQRRLAAGGLRRAQGIN